MYDGDFLSSRKALVTLSFIIFMIWFTGAQVETISQDGHIKIQLFSISVIAKEGQLELLAGMMLAWFWFRYTLIHAHQDVTEFRALIRQRFQEGFEDIERDEPDAPRWLSFLLKATEIFAPHFFALVATGCLVGMVFDLGP